MLGRQLHHVRVPAVAEHLHHRRGHLGDVGARRRAATPPAARSRRRSCRSAHRRARSARSRTRRHGRSRCSRRGAAWWRGPGWCATPAGRSPTGAVRARACADSARRRISARHSPSGEGSSISAEDDVDDAVEDLLLVRDVVVDRHRLHPERLGQRADRERPDPAGVRDLEGGAAAPGPGSAGPARVASCSPGCSRHGEPDDSTFVLCKVRCLTKYGSGSPLQNGHGHGHQHPPPSDPRPGTTVPDDDAGDHPGAVRLRRQPAPRPRSPRREPGDDEVLLRVHAAGLDRGTWHLMTGRPTRCGSPWASAGRRTRSRGSTSPARSSPSARR